MEAKCSSGALLHEAMLAERWAVVRLLDEAEVDPDGREGARTFYLAYRETRLKSDRGEERCSCGIDLVGLRRELEERAKGTDVFTRNLLAARSLQGRGQSD